MTQPSNLDDRLQAFRAKSQVFKHLTEPWVGAQLAQIMSADVTEWNGYDLVVASDWEDLELATDYTATMTATRTASIGFRGRSVEKSFTKARGPVRQMTLRCAGALPHGTVPGKREYDKVLAGRSGDFYVTVWCSGIGTDDAGMEAAIIVDLNALRAIPPVRRRKMEIPGRSNVPFVGIDAAALIAHDCCPAIYPSIEYFASFMPHDGEQGGLW